MQIITYKIPRKHISLIQRFEASYIPEPNTGCWLWIGSTATRDYGIIQRGSRRMLAHRLSYELSIGPIPEGLVIDHLCRMHCCVNPEHLEAVPQVENVRRGLVPKYSTDEEKRAGKLEAQMRWRYSPAGTAAREREIAKRNQRSL